MAIISRVKTWGAEILQYTDLNTEFNNLINFINNVDAATTTWDNVKTALLTMTGNVIMSSNKVTGMAAATTNGDALRYEQLIGLYLLLTGGTMSGPIAMGTSKITGLGNGSAAQDAMAFGQLFNGFQAPVQLGDVTNKATTSSTFQDTALAVSITPTSASHRIRVTVSCFISVNNTATSISSTVKRGVTNIGGTDGFARTGGITNGALGSLAYSYIDSPATTSSTTYTMQIRSTDNTNSVEYAPSGSVKNMIILEEIV